MKFRSDPARIRGSIAPLVTPFTASGAADHESLRAMVRWQLDRRRQIGEELTQLGHQPSDL